MGHIIGYIISSIIASIISGVLLIGIPFGVLLEMKGLGDYMYALTIILASLMELIWFLFLLFVGGDFHFSLKDIIKKIKSFFKKEKETNKNKEKKNNQETITSRERFFYIVEGIILIAIAIYVVINPQHSSISNLIYNGLIIKILAGIFIPLIIINTINLIALEGDGFFSGIGTQISTILLSIVLGFIITTGMLFVASVWYPDIEQTIRKSWFIYDNPNFDKIRNNDSFNATEYLKNEYQKLIDTYKQNSTCDLNEEHCMKEFKLKIIRELDTRNASIRTYGYKYHKRIEVDKDNDVVCITDMKTTHNLFYRINYMNFNFEEITMDEYNSYA